MLASQYTYRGKAVSFFVLVIMSNAILSIAGITNFTKEESIIVTMTTAVKSGPYVSLRSALMNALSQ